MRVEGLRAGVVAAGERRLAACRIYCADGLPFAWDELRFYRTRFTPARRSQCGQSTVEYAVVLVAFLSVALAFGALWHAGRDGRLLRLVVQSASHLLGGGDALGSANDILLF